MTFSKGCGCLLVALGSVAILIALALAWGSWRADEDAGEKNRAEWEEYNAWTEQLDSIEDSVMVDSLMASHPRPVIRQGGFATALGILMGLCIVVFGAFLLGIGCILLVRNNMKKRKEKALEEELLNRNRKL